MKTIPASEIKRRGIIALEERLPYGPVHIIKNNRPSCVVLTEEEYQQLMLEKKHGENPKSGLDFMLAKPATGQKTRKALDKSIKKVRNEWNK